MIISSCLCYFALDVFVGFGFLLLVMCGLLDCAGLSGIYRTSLCFWLNGDMMVPVDHDYFLGSIVVRRLSTIVHCKKSNFFRNTVIYCYVL